MNIDDLDIEKLRNDLIDYYGTAMFSGFGVALMDLSKVEKSNDYELIKIAMDNGFDLNKYIKKFGRRF